MATGYNIIQPNGEVAKQQYTTDEERRIAIDKLLSKWEQYCQDNWISYIVTDLFPPERRVKLFLDGLAYFSLLGNMEDIVTDYKNVVRGNSEIPISSCPAYIKDRLYGSGNAVPNEAERVAFDGVLEKLEEAAEKRCGKHTKVKKEKQKKETRMDIMRRIKDKYGISRFHFLTVNTENEFVFEDQVYVIDDSVPEYAPKVVGTDRLYDMDKIIVAKLHNGTTIFFNQNMKKIDSEKINKKIF